MMRLFIRGRDTRAATGGVGLQPRCGVHFVVSAPRSGSTWLKQLLNGHPGVCCTENRLFGGFFEVWPDGGGAKSPRITMDEFTAQLCYRLPLAGRTPEEAAPDLFETLVDALLSFLRRDSGKQCVVDKVTPYLGTMGTVLAGIGRHFPGSRIVHLVRDPRDVATSGAFHWVAREDSASPRYLMYVAKKRGCRLPRFFDDDLLRVWAGYWMETAVLDTRPDVLQVRYEKMLADTAGELQRIFAHFGTEASAGDLRACVKGARFEVMSGGRRPGDAVPTAHVRAGVAGGWRKYFTRRDGALLHELAGERMQRLGYVTGADWYNDLPDTLDLVA